MTRIGMTLEESLAVVDRFEAMEHKLDTMKFEIAGLKLDIEKLQRTAPTICCCKDDWTDGGVYCQSCGLERK
jgi:hypothetical protein